MAALRVILAIFAILVVGGMLIGEDDNMPRSSSSMAASNGGDNRQFARAPPLELLSWNCSRENSFIYVRGEVRNISSVPLENILSIGTFRTADGTLVKTADALIHYDPLMPGQASPFEAGTRDNPAIDRCNVSFTKLLGAPLEHTVAEDEAEAEQERIKRAQRELSALGYDVGVADGIAGPKTEAAVRAFQRDYGMAEDGQINDLLLRVIDNVQ